VLSLFFALKSRAKGPQVWVNCQFKLE